MIDNEIRPGRTNLGMLKVATSLVKKSSIGIKTQTVMACLMLQKPCNLRSNFNQRWSEEKHCSRFYVSSLSADLPIFTQEQRKNVELLTKWALFDPFTGMIAVLVLDFRFIHCFSYLGSVHTSIVSTLSGSKLKLNVKVCANTGIFPLRLQDVNKTHTALMYILQQIMENLL